MAQDSKPLEMTRNILPEEVCQHGCGNGTQCEDLQVQRWMLKWVLSVNKNENPNYLYEHVDKNINCPII
jgi:hypothetical protein